MAQNLSEAERLMAEMSAKYGVSSKPVEQPIQAPKQVAPQPPPQPKSRGLVSDAMDLFSGRKAQIDKASGYACGGKIKAHAQGGKISGPGTPTSDSIPAEVSNTGEPILVSNGERIVSAKQDAALARIAEMLGYGSVDAMFEKMTGEPVGPTMKNGKRAARWGANGEWIQEQETEETLNNGTYTGDGASLIGDFKNWQNKKIAETGAKLDASMGKSSPVAQPTNPLVAGANTSYDQSYPQSFPSAPGISSVTEPTAARPVITNDSAQSAYGNDMKRSGGIFGTTDLAGQNDRMAKSLGYASADDFNARKANAPAGGIAVLGEVAPGRTQADMDNTEKSRRWMAEDMLKRGRGGAAAAAQLMGLGTTERGQDAQERVAGLNNETARYGHDVTAQRAAGHDQAIMRGQDLQYGNPLDMQTKQLGVDQAKRIAMLTEKAAAGDVNALGELRVRGIIKSEEPKYLTNVVGGGANEAGVLQPQRLAITDQSTGASRFADEKPAGQAAAKFEAGKTYTDAKGNKAQYQADGTWKEIK